MDTLFFSNFFLNHNNKNTQDIDAPVDIIGENEKRTIIIGGFFISGPLSMRSTWMKSSGSGLCNISDTMYVIL